MAWMIVSDSSCEIRELKNPAPGVQFALVPFKIRVGEREYVDLATLNTQQMLQAMTDYNGASTTACPSPEEWAEYFCRRTTCLPSPSAATCPAATMPPWLRARWCWRSTPKENFCAGHAELLRCAGRCRRAGQQADWRGSTFDDICFALKKFADSTHILFALASFDNLAKKRPCQQGSWFYRRPPEHARSGPPHAGRQD